VNISAPFIARPIATTLLAIAMVLLGLFGYQKLPIAALPQVDFPTIQVITQLPGASAQTTASLITAPLERQFGLIAGLISMLSTSSEGLSTITLQFNLDKNLDVASQDVQAAINAANGVLPKNLPYPPNYLKVNPADAPILTLSLTSTSRSITEVNNFADTVLSQKLSQISSVGRVITQGGQRPAFRIQINPERLTSYGISLEEVRATLGKANVNIPKGSFEGTLQAITLAANDQIEDAETYRNVILHTHNGNVVRVRDVGEVIESVENTRAGGWVNGKPAVIIDIQRQPGANIVATADAIKNLLTHFSDLIPEGIELNILADRTETIRASVHDVQFTMVLTMVLVIIVIYGFLRSGSATFITGITLPIALVVTFGVMSLCGFSLNNLSLMALTIAAGFVVDDAIVMIENIVRNIEKGETPLAAAYHGAREIAFTVISLTASLVAVFIPLLFMSGIIGRLFQEFALTLTIAVVASAVISLTLTPMMCAGMLKAGVLKHAVARNGFFARLQTRYATSLQWVLARQKATLLLSLLTLILTIFLYMIIPKGFIPAQDTGHIIGATDAAQTISFAEMSRLQRQVAEVMMDDEDVAQVASSLGIGTMNATANTGHFAIILKPKSQRNASAQEIVARLNTKLRDITGIETYLQVAQDIQIGARRSRTQYQYTLTDLNAAQLTEWSEKLLAILKESSVLTDVASDQQQMGLKADIRINRDQASRLGIQPEAIDNTLYNAFGQRQISTVYSQVNQYRVILEVAPQFRRTVDALSHLHIKSSNGELVPLAAFADVAIVSAPLSIIHQGQFPQVTISFNLQEGTSLGTAVAVITNAQKSLEMPSSITGNYSGDAAEFQLALSNQPLLILASLITIYIVLGVLYESMIHPITILSTLPSAGVGALLALLLTGHDLSLLAIIGIILLMGIVKKNAIMMIDFALVAEREHAMPPRDAIYQACIMRFRPIMMTTMAALLGAVPLAFDTGIGAELRRPLGITILGGLLISQALTLFTTPVVYLAMGRVSTWLRNRV
jgi:multidrug efflux pump